MQHFHTFTNSTVALFIDGKKVASDTDADRPADVSRDKSYIGLSNWHSSTPDGELRAYVDELRLSNHSINESMVITDHNSVLYPDQFICEGICLAESISLTDSIAKSPGVNLSESVSLTDSISKSAGVNLSESVLLTDSISKTAGVNLSESISLTDSIAKSAGVNLSESVSLTDSISKVAGVNLSESVSLTDSISKTAGVNLSESV